MASVKNEALLENLIHSSPTPIFMKDLQGRYLFVNAAYEKAVGLPHEALVGHTDFDLYPPEVATSYRRGDMQALDAAAPIQREEPLIKDGDERTYTVVKFPLFGEDNEIVGICGVSMEITDSLRNTEVRGDERRRLAGELHDDALQVMAAVGLRIEVLEQDATGDVETKLAELRTMVADALQRLRTLTSDLQVTDSVKVNLRASLQQILEEIEREHSIAFSLRDHVGNKARSFLAVGLTRIAREALTNVTKHARASHVDVSIAEINGGVQITIADDGVGFQEDETRNPEHMGLASMRSRAHALGGALRIYPREGGGTCLEIWAPEPQQRRSSDRAG